MAGWGVVLGELRAFGAAWLARGNAFRAVRQPGAVRSRNSKGAAMREKERRSGGPARCCLRGRDEVPPWRSVGCGLHGLVSCLVRMQQVG